MERPQPRGRGDADRRCPSCRPPVARRRTHVNSERGQRGMGGPPARQSRKQAPARLTRQGQKDKAVRPIRDGSSPMSFGRRPVCLLFRGRNSDTLRYRETVRYCQRSVRRLWRRELLTQLPAASLETGRARLALPVHQDRRDGDEEAAREHGSRIEVDRALFLFVEVADEAGCLLEPAAFILGHCIQTVDGLVVKSGGTAQPHRVGCGHPPPSVGERCGSRGPVPEHSSWAAGLPRS